MTINFGSSTKWKKKMIVLPVSLIDRKVIVLTISWQKIDSSSFISQHISYLYCNFNISWLRGKTSKVSIGKLNKNNFLGKDHHAIKIRHFPFCMVGVTVTTLRIKVFLKSKLSFLNAQYDWLFKQNINMQNANKVHKLS